jgi:stage V sporulation protein SpoVS
MLAFPHKPCSVCGTPLTVHRVVHGFCESPKCLVAIGQRRVADRHAEERAAIQAVAEAHRQALMTQHPHLRKSGVDVVVVPGFDAAMQPMIKQRRDTLRTHLEEVLSATPLEVAKHLAIQRSNATQQVLNAACATCRGYCCRKGGDSAYIKAETIARVRRHHPDLSNDAIAATYINAVPEISATDSCIFHGEQGCTLPRDFRADICNDYHCSPLEGWINGESRLPAVTVAIDDGQIVRSTLIEAV